MSDNNFNSDQPQPGAVPPQPSAPAGQPAAPTQPVYGAPDAGAQYGAPGAQPQYAAPGAPQYAAPGMPGRAPSNGEPSFFSALFDLEFRHFITLKFAKIIFIILMVLAALSWLVAIVAGFIAHPGVGIAALLLGWIGPFITLVVYRVGLEVAVSLVRTAQNTSTLVDRS